MSPLLILTIFIGYFLLLYAFAHFTSGSGSNDAFFIGERKSPWYLVAFGMIGASLSGVTFLSVPGVVGAIEMNEAGAYATNGHFSYLQVVMGNVLGYLLIAMILLPLYYRLRLTSIYEYLRDRLGFWSHKTGASFFLLSRIIGASFRLYLVVLILQTFVCDALGIHFVVTTSVIIFMIWLYTLKGGIKTIVWTDPLQTSFMLIAVFAAIYYMTTDLEWSFAEMLGQVKNSTYSKVFFFDDANENRFFWKQFLGGAAIAFAMMGLDQDMMQKHNSCPTIGDAKKNMFSFTLAFFLVNIVFLTLGAMLFLYAAEKGITLPSKTDEVFATIALGNSTLALGFIFLIGLIAAAFSSADSALTALTTSFCVDLLGYEEKNEDVFQEQKQRSTRKWVHVAFSIVLLCVISFFFLFLEKDVVTKVFVWATYTYGPLLGLFLFGIITSYKVHDSLVPVVCILSPIICFVLQKYSATWFGGYQIGFELLLINGLITFVGLLLLKRSVAETERLF